MIVPVESSILSLDKAIENLNSNASGISSMMKSYEMQLEQIQKNMENLTTGETDLDKEIVRESERYDYFQGLAGYVNDLGEFLDAKVTWIENNSSLFFFRVRVGGRIHICTKYFMGLEKEIIN